MTMDILRESLEKIKSNKNFFQFVVNVLDSDSCVSIDAMEKDSNSSTEIIASIRVFETKEITFIISNFDMEH